MVDKIFCGMVEDKTFQTFRDGSIYWDECRNRKTLMLKNNQSIKTKHTYNQLTFCLELSDRLKHLHP